MRRGRRETGRGWPGALARASLLAALVACAPDGAGGGYALFEHLELAEELVIGADEGWARAAAERMAPRLEAELGLRVVVRPSAEAGGGARRVRMLLGYPDTPALQPALERLGFHVGPTQAGIGPWSFGWPDGSALVATLPDPAHADSPLTVFVALEAPGPVGRAHSDLDIARELRPTWRTGWQVWDDAGLVSQGELDPDGRALPGSPPRRSEPAAPAAELIAQSPDLAFLETDLSMARERVSEVLGASPALAGFEPALRVHRRPEGLALVARAWRPYRCAPATGVVDLVVAPGLFVDARAAFAELFARRGAREPREAWMVEGLVRHVARSWWGRDLDAWCAHLARAGLAPQLEQLVSPAPELSPHVVAPLRGLLLDVLLATRGSDEVRRLWREGGLVLDEPLRAAFAARLEDLVRRHGPALEAARTARRAQVLARPFRRGVALVPAFEREDPLDSGLGSAPGRASLERIAALGADAVSLDVASFVLAPWSAHALEPRGRPVALVDDLELQAACAAARAHDLAVLLKPDLWLAPISTLAGEELVHTSGQWRLFFDTFEHRLVHYALLAELAGVEVVRVGSELHNATATYRDHGDSRWPADHFEWKRRRWSGVLASARAAFGGGLTYAVRWDEALEALSFWDQLDFVGVDLYPSLGPMGEGPPRLEQVSQALERALQRIEMAAAAIGKRLLVVELGFPSSRDAWPAPSLPRGPADENAQALFLSALSLQRRAWDRRQSSLAGLYVWCWSAEPGGASTWERGYTLQGKRGERALERAFQDP